MKKVIILRKGKYIWGNKVFHSTILQAFQFEPEQKVRVVMRAMRKKINKFTLLLLIYYIWEEISIQVNADIARAKREK